MEVVKTEITIRGDTPVGSFIYSFQERSHNEKLLFIYLIILFIYLLFAFQEHQHIDKGARSFFQCIVSLWTVFSWALSTTGR